MKLIRAMSLALLFAAAIALPAGLVLAQAGPTGAISGTVVDSTGGVIASATIQILDSRTGELSRNLATTSTGTFTVPLLQPGTYDVVVNAGGFGEVRISGVAVHIAETTALKITLKPGQVTEKVVVSAELLNVNTENATMGQTIEPGVVSALPLATQNFQQLLALSSGTASHLNNAEQLGRGDVRIQVNGQREDNNNYLIEGITANDYNIGELTNTPLPNPDVIQEFKVSTSLYDATQGRNAGGIINAVLKSGTNNWHGDAYEFFRNDVLNANDFFLSRVGQPRPVLKQNVFGGSIGGPLRSKGHFGYIFGNYQGSRQRSGADLGTFISSVLPILPTDRSAASLSETFFGNPNTPLDPVTLKLLNIKGNLFCASPDGFLIPSIPGTPGLNPDGSVRSAPFACSHPGTFRDDQFTLAWDRDFHQLKDKLAVRWFFSNSHTLKPFGAGDVPLLFGGGTLRRTDLNFPLDLPLKNRFLNATWTHTFSGTKINQFRFGYIRVFNDFLTPPPVTAAQVGITSPPNVETQTIYKFGLLSSGFELGPTDIQFHARQNNFVYNDVFSWGHGNHQIRFGAEFDRAKLDADLPPNGGLVDFVNTPASGATPAYTDFQNLLLGAPVFGFGLSGVANHNFRQNNFAAFAQDDWKATRDLNLNLGLRLEAFGAWADNANHIGNVNPNLVLAGQSPWIYPRGVNSLGIPGLHGTTNSTTMNNQYSLGWGPRIGFAYDVLGHHTTTIRGGYGIFYAREDAGTADQLTFTPPFIPELVGPVAPGNLANAFTPPSPLGLPPLGVIDPGLVPVLSQLTGFVDATGNPTKDTSQVPVYNGNTVNLIAEAVPLRFIVPMTQEWNLTIQRSLGRNWSLEAGYVGSHTVHLREARALLQSVLVSPQNPLVVTGANGQKFSITKNTLANAVARSPFQGINGYSGFQWFAPDAYAHYHSLQLTLLRRWSQGHFQAAYTFSRSTDVVSTTNTAFDTTLNDQSNLNSSRGLSDFDRKHRLVVSYLYELPFFRHATHFRGQLLGGWAVSGVTIFQSGAPFSVLDSAAATAFDTPGLMLATASLAPGARLNSGLTSGSTKSRLDNYLNIKAFQPAPIIGDDGLATGFGNLGRNTYRGPFMQNWDFSLLKNFSVTEHQQIRFTADFFNIWNHPAFASPAFVDVESPATFGDIISTENNPRIIQFSLRWSF